MRAWWPRRRARDPLGEGVWRRAHDRFQRAVDRYHQVLERVPDAAVRSALERPAGQLAGALDEVRAVCVRAQQLAPSAGEDLPGGHGGALLDVHRALTRAATLAAQAAEAVTLVVVTLRAGGEAPVAAAERATAQAVTQVRRAAALLPAPRADDEE